MIFWLFVVNVLVYDVWFYITHYILHHEYLYNRIHYIHHTARYNELKWYNTSDGHIIEHAIQGVGLVLPCIIYYDFNTLCASVIFIHVKGYIRHDDRASWLCGNHHILHHKHFKCNYSEYYVDWIFGTEHVAN